MHSRYRFVVIVSLLALGAPASSVSANDAALGTGQGVPVIHGAGRSGDIVTFESLDLPAGSQMDLADGASLTVEGYTFTPGPNNDSGLNDSHYGNAVTFWGYNGTHVAAYHDDVVMEKGGGGSFDLVSFDLCGWPVDSEVAFTVTGQPGNVVANFTPDGLVDGPGGVTDFQTFELPPGFDGLTSVTFEHFGPGTLQGIFSLDNLVVGKPVSVDGKSWGEVKGGYRE